jgi:hypothetical protein
MKKKGLAITAILPIVTVLLSSLFLSPTYSAAPFIYEDEVIGMLGEEKQKMANTLEDIYTYIPEGKRTKEGKFWANYIFNNVKVFDSEYPTLESIKEFRKDPPKSNNTNHYISLIIKNREKTSTETDIVETLLQYTLEKEIILAKSILRSDYFEELLEKNEIRGDLRYQNIVESVPRRPIQEVESIFYAESIAPELKEDSSSIKTEPILTEKPRPSSSRDITLTITILPVRFVYVDSEYQIVKIWNNVKKDDGKYGLKFYDEQTKKEIDGNDYIMAQFNSLLLQIDPFTEGLIYDRSVGIEKKDYATNVDIQFNEREEIYTLI